jgi:hypothetical protein
VEKNEDAMPFLIVIRDKKLTLAQAMSKVNLNGKTGVCYLSDNEITDLDDLPVKNYLAVDVKFGNETLKIKPSLCHAQFKAHNRLGGTVAEGIMALIYKPEILNRHFINLISSRY